MLYKCNGQLVGAKTGSPAQTPVTELLSSDDAYTVTTTRAPSKRLVYLSVVLGLLLYGSKMWAIKSRTMHKLETFHNRCMWCILGITSEQQIQARITTKSVRRRFGLHCSFEGDHNEVQIEMAGAGGQNGRGEDP